MSSSKKGAQTSNNYKIFCDLDGVLVDFEKGALELFDGQYSSTSFIAPFELWPKINKVDFYRDLCWTSDGALLWEILLDLYLQQENGIVESLSVLTGVPRTKKSKAQKFEWCQNHLHLDTDHQDASIKLFHVDKAAPKSGHKIVNATDANLSATLAENQKRIDIITCWSKNKHCESKTNHVLIDDRLELKSEWVKKGGTFIHHKNTNGTIRQLIQCGILSKDSKYAIDVGTDEEEEEEVVSKKRKVAQMGENEESVSAVTTPATKKIKKLPPIDTTSPLMILLLGMPGAGKSHFSETLASTYPNKFVRICQDVMKTRKKCEKMCRAALDDGKIPLIDRTNYNCDQRKHFVDIAAEYDNCSIDIVHFDYSREECLRRCESRPDHETLSSDSTTAKKLNWVVNRIGSMLKVPDDKEGKKYRHMLTVRSFEEADSTRSRYC